MPGVWVAPPYYGALWDAALLGLLWRQIRVLPRLLGPLHRILWRRQLRLRVHRKGLPGRLLARQRFLLQPQGQQHQQCSHHQRLQPNGREQRHHQQLQPRELQRRPTRCSASSRPRGSGSISRTSRAADERTASATEGGGGQPCSVRRSKQGPAGDVCGSETGNGRPWSRARSGDEAGHV